MKHSTPLDIRIDRLTLRAMPPGGEDRLRRAVEFELRSLMRDRPTRPRYAPVPSRTQAAAAQIAASIYRRLQSS
jgi:hypothetical protein